MRNTPPLVIHVCNPVVRRFRIPECAVANVGAVQDPGPSGATPSQDIVRPPADGVTHRRSKRYRLVPGLCGAVPFFSLLFPVSASHLMMG